MSIASKNILDTSISWGEFNTKINNEIISKNLGFTSTEDKRLGVFFISESDLTFFEKNNDDNLPQNTFAEKVLKYLWDDAFKFCRAEIFDSKYTTLESLISAFESEIGNRRFKIFVDGIFDLT